HYRDFFATMGSSDFSVFIGVDFPFQVILLPTSTYQGNTETSLIYPNRLPEGIDRSPARL
ncbi:MAG: hypothetical protein AB1393_06160, partial [Candidatus Edwardsbacteria bacterium]